MVSVASFRSRNSTAGETKTGGRPVSQRPSSNSAQQGGSERAVCQAVAVHTYTAEDDDDDGSALTFTKGQQMEILEISDDWWRARINGVEGWVPEQYIRRLWTIDVTDSWQNFTAYSSKWCVCTRVHEEDRIVIL